MTSVKTRPAPVGEGGALITRAAKASTADGSPPSRHALAQIGLGDPAGLEDQIEVVLGDGIRLQENRAQRVPARGLKGGGSADLARVGVLAELHRSLARALAEHARVLPHVDRLRA